jgi:peptide deformylase
MVLPIYAYGHPVLKKKCEDISNEYPGLEKLISNMWDTMYHAHGVGLAAPQIGLAIRLFVVDTIQVMEEDKKDQGIKQVFINAKILDESGDSWAYEEGCLSIPNVRGDVERNPKIKIVFMDENFQEHKREFDGVNARVIQHEYDHIEGVLFIEKLNPLKRRLVSRKLDNIRRGKVKAEYNMKFA